jgi:genome maintenance exonuclease 1
MKNFNHVVVTPLQELLTENLDGRRYYIISDDLKLPSVTTVLSHFKAIGLRKWRDRVGDAEADRVMKRASERGTRFHSMLEKYLKNDPFFYEEVMPDLRQNFLDVEDTLDLIDNIRHIEAPLYSRQLGIAGRTDVIGDYNAIPSIIDFKTSLRPKKLAYVQSYFEQATAYSLMYEEMSGEVTKQIVVIIMVDGEDEPQVFIKNRDDYVDALMEKINTYKQEMVKCSLNYG